VCVKVLLRERRWVWFTYNADEFVRIVEKSREFSTCCLFCVENPDCNFVSAYLIHYSV
jgi:hypothetical protein